MALVSKQNIISTTLSVPYVSMKQYLFSININSAALGDRQLEK